MLIAAGAPVLTFLEQPRVVQMPPPPLLGYNNNVRHRGRVFHIQTEDSGVGHPRIMTHLFADGGRIVKSIRTDYSEHLGRSDLAETVRGLMKEQHKAMFVALRGGELDALIGFEVDAPPPTISGSAVQAAAAELTSKGAATPVAAPASVTAPASVATTDPTGNAGGGSARGEVAAANPRPIDAPVADPGERPSERSSQGARRPSDTPPRETDSSRRQADSGVQRAAEPVERSYAAPRPATIFAEAPVRDSLFGETVMEKSLDETILSYLSEDAEAADGTR